jgi:hypothetical protein
MDCCLAVPMLWERGFTCVGYIDDPGSCLPFTGECNLNAHPAQRGLCPPQATGERPRISGPAAPGTAIWISDAKRKKISGSPYPSFPLGHNLAHAARQRIGRFR